jgi:hypothetical protein
MAPLVFFLTLPQFSSYSINYDLIKAVPLVSLINSVLNPSKPLVGTLNLNNYLPSFYSTASNKTPFLLLVSFSIIIGR